MLCLTLVFSAAAAPLAAQSGAPRWAFVTSTYGPADLSQWPDADDGAVGAAAGDSICRARAAAAGLDGPEGYRAWLSDGVDDAWCRVQGLTGRRESGCGGAPTLPGAGPWARRDGVRWAGSLDELTDGGGPLVPLDLDEQGQPTGESSAHWTGTASDGRAILGPPALSCGDWTSAQASDSGSQGVVFGTREAWTEFFLANCSSHHRLVCLESGPPGATPPIASPGPAALAFVTASVGPADLGSWPGANVLTGLEAADAICRADAVAARLPNPASFVAWLSSSAADAVDRLPASLAWARLDGVGLASNRADLADGRLAAPLNLTSARRYLPEPQGETLAWTGTAFDGTSVPDSTCADWTSTADLGLAGEVNLASAGWTDGMPSDCAADLPLYCFSTVEILFWDPFESGSLERWSGASP
jgi:hypothetical protein